MWPEGTQLESLGSGIPGQVVPSPVGNCVLCGLADFGRGADLFGLISLNINKIPSVFPGSGMSFQNHVLCSSFQLGAFAGGSQL